MLMSYRYYGLIRPFASAAAGLRSRDPALLVCVRGHEVITSIAVLLLLLTAAALAAGRSSMASSHRHGLPGPTARSWRTPLSTR
jgi:hypothetical protein